MKKFFFFIKRPIDVIRKGLMHYEEQMHMDNCIKKYNKSQLPTIDILDLLNDELGSVSPYSFLDGTSLISDIALLKGLAKKYQECSYLEIGSWRGESISNVADVARECVSVTLSTKEMRSMNWPEDFIRVHGFFSKEKQNIKTIEANSHTFDFKSLNKKFDLIFVDGDHTYKGVLNDTRKVFELRKDQNSIIVWHDYGFGVENVRYSVLEGILDGIPLENHRNLYHVSNTMCVIYMENCDLNKILLGKNSVPNKLFSLAISAKRIL